MENQVRELLRDIAEDIPLQREMPPTLRPRARRRIAATVGVTVVAFGALALGGVVAVRSITESSPRPANPRPTTVQLPDAPEAWQRIALPYSDGCPPDNCHVELVAAGDTGLVAASYTEIPSGKEFVGWSSPDGVSWHPIEGDVRQSVGTSHGVEGLAAAGPGFVAVGRTGVWASTDGVSWDLAYTSPDDYFTSVTAGGHFTSVTAGGPGVVAVGGANKAWYSSDGLTWEAAEVPPVPADVYPGDDGETPQVYMTHVAAGADRLVATGSMTLNNEEGRPAMWVSSDGTSWRDVPIDGDIFPRGCDNIIDLAGDPDGFVAVVGCSRSGEDFVLRSPDGEHWERVGGDTFDGETPGSVAASPTGFIAAGDQGVWTSVDGESWTRVPAGSAFQGAGARDVTAWGSRFVVVGGADDGRNWVWISGPQQ